MLPNLSVIWVIFFVLLMTFVLNRFLLIPVLDVIRKREEASGSARELAARSAREAAAASTEFDRRTTAARGEMYREMDEMRRAATDRRTEIVAQTRTESAAQLADAMRQLDEQAAEARRRLEADAQTLGAAVADRVLGRQAN
jgi:F0F1-type ATP synthase membrane subunit b/b'